MAVRTPVTMRNVQEANLAWALIDVAKPHMNAGERNFVFVSIGAGDTFAAIRGLINLAAVKRIPMRPHLVQLCRTWLDAYSLHDEHGHLRRVIEDILMPNTIQAYTGIRRPSVPAKPLSLLAVTGR
jgi:hypothetical protein